MSVSAHLFSTAGFWLALVLGCAVLAVAIITSPWIRLREGHQIHVWLGSCVAVMILWTIHPTALRGFDFHFLGATLFTLMFGSRLAMVGFAVAIAGLVAWGRLSVETAPFDFLILAVLPITLSLLTLRLAERVLPRNFFVYIFVVAFFGSGIAVLVSDLISAAMIIAFAPSGDAAMASQFTPFVIFLAFAEATLTGMLVTLMVVYRPQWIATFDDASYLRPR